MARQWLTAAVNRRQGLLSWSYGGSDPGMHRAMNVVGGGYGASRGSGSGSGGHRTWLSLR